MTGRLFTSESVTEGHPDKIADQISDTVLDYLLAHDPKSRVAVETLLTTGLVHKGDPDAGFAEATAIVEGEFESGFVEHAYIEPEAGFARRVGDRIETVPMTDGHGQLTLPPQASITIDPHSKVLRQSDAIDRFQAWKATQPKRTHR